jgi:hypothetical protein
MRPEIYLTDYQARRAAKSFFAELLSISRRSVTVEVDHFFTNRYGSTQCACGETRAVYFKMANAGKTR